MKNTFLMRGAAMLLTVQLAAGAAPVAAETAQTAANSVPNAILLVGGEIKPHSTGSLSLQNSELTFQVGESSWKVKMDSIDDISTGSDSKQVGGVPLTLAKMGVPFGGGRVVSLISHKKFDTLAIEYHDANGGYHGVLFSLPTGQAAGFRQQLVTAGAHVAIPTEATDKTDKNDKPAKEAKQ